MSGSEAVRLSLQHDDQVPKVSVPTNRKWKLMIFLKPLEIRVTEVITGKNRDLPCALSQPQWLELRQTEAQESTVTPMGGMVLNTCAAFSKCINKEMEAEQLRLKLEL